MIDEIIDSFDDIIDTIYEFDVIIDRLRGRVLMGLMGSLIAVMELLIELMSLMGLLIT